MVDYRIVSYSDGIFSIRDSAGFRFARPVKVDRIILARFGSNPKITSLKFGHHYLFVEYPNVLVSLDGLPRGDENSVLGINIQDWGELA
jgi:hypothetical protein